MLHVTVVQHVRSEDEHTDTYTYILRWCIHEDDTRMKVTSFFFKNDNLCFRKLWWCWNTILFLNRRIFCFSLSWKDSVVSKHNYFWVVIWNNTHTHTHIPHTHTHTLTETHIPHTHHTHHTHTYTHTHTHTHNKEWNSTPGSICDACGVWAQSMVYGQDFTFLQRWYSSVWFPTYQKGQ